MRCQHRGCTEAATYVLTWRQPMALCGFHAQQMAWTAFYHGQRRPRATLRLLREAEKIPPPEMYY